MTLIAIIKMMVAAGCISRPMPSGFGSQFYGVDLVYRDELLQAQMRVEEIKSKREHDKNCNDLYDKMEKLIEEKKK